jgi:Flp pilus assembly protein TadG
MKRTRNNERGTAMIEMAITLPLLLLVAVGIFEFGRAFQTWQVLTNAAREGARIASLTTMTQANVESRVRQYMTDGKLDKAGSATVTVNNNSTVSIGTANVSASQVTVVYPFEFTVLNPVAKLVVSNSTVGSALQMTAAASMRNETAF